MTIRTDSREPRPSRLQGRTGVIYRGMLGGSLAALTYLASLAGYIVVGPTEILSYGPAVHPLVWITAAVAAVTALGRPTEPITVIRVAIAAAYVVLLALVSGTVSFGMGGFSISTAGGFPGWAPIVSVEAGVVSAVIVPYRLLGYLTLGYLLIGALGSRSGSTAAGVTGLLSCAGCVLPFAAALGSLGSSSILAVGVTDTISTVAFVATAALLVGLTHVGSGCEACQS